MSIDGTYNISVQTPMGSQKGTLTIKVEGNSFSGNLETASGSSDFSSGIINGNVLHWRAETKTPMGAFDVSYKATIEGNTLSGEAATPFGSVPMEGTKI